MRSRDCVDVNRVHDKNLLLAYLGEDEALLAAGNDGLQQLKQQLHLACAPGGGGGGGGPGG